MRLQKFLARAGVASRRASENLMTDGRVTVNGKVVRELGNALLHPSHHVPKTYVATIEGNLSDGQADLLRRGVELDDGLTQPAEIAFIGKRRNRVRITIHEGRYHQVKRMFEAVGHPVRNLHRERFGDLTLGNLQPGQWRELTPEELRRLIP